MTRWSKFGFSKHLLYHLQYSKEYLPPIQPPKRRESLNSFGSGVQLDLPKNKEQRKNTINFTRVQWPSVKVYYFHSENQYSRSNINAYKCLLAIKITFLNNACVTTYTEIVNLTNFIIRYTSEYVKSQKEIFFFRQLVLFNKHNNEQFIICSFIV